MQHLHTLHSLLTITWPSNQFHWWLNLLQLASHQLHVFGWWCLKAQLFQRSVWTSPTGILLWLILGGTDVAYRSGGPFPVELLFSWSILEGAPPLVLLNLLTVTYTSVNQILMLSCFTPALNGAFSKKVVRIFMHDSILLHNYVTFKPVSLVAYFYPSATWFAAKT